MKATQAGFEVGTAEAQHSVVIYPAFWWFVDLAIVRHYRCSIKPSCNRLMLLESLQANALGHHKVGAGRFNLVFVRSNP
ncbi:hypothetical protein L9G74_20875, partial [Shewanella sp. C32]